MFTHEIIETTDMLRREVLGQASSFTEAKNMVHEMGALYMEDDADYPGCADAYLTGGRVVSIQPIGFLVTHERASC